MQPVHWQLVTASIATATATGTAHNTTIVIGVCAFLLQSWNYAFS